MPATLPAYPDSVPMGANVVAGGTTFRCWAPRAKQVFVRGSFNGFKNVDSGELVQRGPFWVGQIANVGDGATYKFWVKGHGSEGYKRDPWAREVTPNAQDCVVRDPHRYQWADHGYKPPKFHEMIVYELHVGVFYGPNRRRRVAKFLDVLRKLDYLRALGVNAIELMPFVEWRNIRSQGYEGVDIFSPERDYCVTGADLKNDYLPLVNGLRKRHGLGQLDVDDLSPQPNQLKALIELCHLNGIAVLCDAVYNHAGPTIGGDSESLWFFDRAAGTNALSSLYFSDKNWTGPMWAIYVQEVKQFLIDNAVSFLREYHFDGFRYDETSAIVGQLQDSGRAFLRALSGTVRYAKPNAIQIGEYWRDDKDVAVRPTNQGGLGFDAVWHDGLRNAVRAAVDSASYGASARVSVSSIAANLWPPGLPDAWRGVQCLEDHDTTYKDKPRLVRLADRNDTRSWWARSRARVANGILLTAPGIPMIFMGQEILEDKSWRDDAGNHPGQLIWWEGLDEGLDSVMDRFHHYFEELVRMRRTLRGLVGDGFQVLQADDFNRVLAFQRWEQGAGHDVIVVASFNDRTLSDYLTPWPADGRWRERFNSDAYDNYVPTGNAGGVDAWWEGRGRSPATARLTIPANSLLMFTR
jgi:1,4-alpha-glucan branching enzyme